MEQKGLTKKAIELPAFVEDAFDSVEKMTAFADLLLNSKLCPDHLYEKGSDKKPDYTKGKTSAAVMVLLQGHQLGLPPLMALQHVIPINGLLSLKGIAAKSLILNSGKVKRGSWKEEISGSIEEGDYCVTITAARSDTEETSTRSFSITDANRAGLIPSTKQLEGPDGWKYKSSPYIKYPKRMIFYRCIGDLAKDLFPDVIHGLYTFEEAQDMPQDTEVIVETASGAKIIIPDKEFAEERSETLTGKLSAKLTGKDLNLMDRAPIPQEQLYIEDELKKMGIGIFSKVKKEFPELNDLLEKLPGKRTQAKWRKGVLSWQKDPEAYSGISNDEIIGASEKKFQEEHTQKPADQLEFEKNMSPEQLHDPKLGVKHEGIHVTSLPENGVRNFEDKRRIFTGLATLGINPEIYSKLAGELVDVSSGSTYLSKYENMDAFAKRGEVEHVVELINVFKQSNK